MDCKRLKLRFVALWRFSINLLWVTCEIIPFPSSENHFIILSLRSYFGASVRVSSVNKQFSRPPLKRQYPQYYVRGSGFITKYYPQCSVGCIKVCLRQISTVATFKFITYKDTLRHTILPRILRARRIEIRSVGRNKNVAGKSQLKKTHEEGKLRVNMINSEIQKTGGSSVLDVSRTEADNIDSTDKKLYFSQIREKCKNLLKRRFFVAPAFEIYGSLGGLFDYGPPGCAIKNELESFWRQHFLLNDDILEISGPCITPYSVLKTSGHVDRFTDLMVIDLKTGESYRADKYLEGYIEEKLESRGDSPEDIAELKLIQRKAASLSAESMKNVFDKFGIKSPSGNQFSHPFPFNLMFETKIGAGKVVNDWCMSDDSQNLDESTNNRICYLRPETAQNIFVNFKKLLEFNGGKMPIAAAQVGLGFRNEIAPRNGLLRAREFQMAEIEYFFHPDSSEHPKFNSISHLCLPLVSRDQQLGDGKILRNLTIKEAFRRQILNNEALAYFMARAYLFFLECGIQEPSLRFRQHLHDEMAHYAQDCWDAEVETSYGWVEVAGFADRSAYDLTHHSRKCKIDLAASIKYDSPKIASSLKFIPNRALIGNKFKSKQELICSTIQSKDYDEKCRIRQFLEKDGHYKLKLTHPVEFMENPVDDEVILTSDMIKFEISEIKKSEEFFIPSVIEPSFGIGRLLHCIFEHTFRSRGLSEQEERCFLAIPLRIAPIKCSILPLSRNPRIDEKVQLLKEMLVSRYISCKVDSSTASIGKRYARTDEIGIPYALTVDFRSIDDETITLRERDSMKQVRLKISEIVEVILDLLAAKLNWTLVEKVYENCSNQEIS